jgi:hypothetical protein
MLFEHLYEGWRAFPQNLLSMQRQYYRKPTKKDLSNLMKRDTSFYYGIVEMIEKRVKRVSSIKSEPLIKKHKSTMNITLAKEGYKGMYVSYDVYIGNEQTRSVLNKRTRIIYLQSEFVRTGQVKFVSELRKLDKELVLEIKRIMKWRRK